MRVLVTGSAGYIGAVMTPFLRDAGHEVVGLDSGLFDGADHGPAPEPPELELDVRDVDTEHLTGLDAVIHLAALSNDPLGDLVPQLTYDINHHASIRLARMARAAGVERFLYSSSCSIYGAADTASLVDETAPFAPVTPYAESKVSVESELLEVANDDFSTVSLRNATAYGWSPRLRLDLVLNDLVASATLTGRVIVRSDGTPWRPIVHIEDISRAFLAALEAPRESVHGRAFNVGIETENYQVSDLAHIVAEVVAGAEVDITGETGADPRSYRVDFSAIRAALPAFSPTWDARRGAAQLHAAFQRYGLDEQGWRETYRRLSWLKRRQEERSLEPDLRPLPAART